MLIRIQIVRGDPSGTPHWSFQCQPQFDASPWDSFTALVWNDRRTMSKQFDTIRNPSQITLSMYAAGRNVTNVNNSKVNLQQSSRLDCDQPSDSTGLPLCGTWMHFALRYWELIVALIKFWPLPTNLMWSSVWTSHHSTLLYMSKRCEAYKDKIFRMNKRSKAAY